MNEILLSQMCIGMGMGMVIVPSDFQSIEKLEELEEIIGTAKQRLIQENELKKQRKQEELKREMIRVEDEMLDIKDRMFDLKNRMEELVGEYESL